MSNESFGFGSNQEERRQALLRQLNPLNMALRHQIGLLGLAGFFLLPRFLFPDQMGPYIQLMYLMMFAMSWDVVSGYTGQLSFGHAFFFAIGGYTSAVLNLQHGMSPIASIPAGMVMAGVAGILIGVPALRLRGPYLSLVTLIVPIILAKLFVLFNESLILFGIPLVPEGFGGQSGVGIPDQLFGLSREAVVMVADYQMAQLTTYYFSLLLFILVFAVLYAVTRSSAGTIFTAIREDEDAVAAAGLNPAKFKLFAFTLSGIVGGLAGAAYVHTYATPQPLALLGTANVQMSINVIIMTVLGGIGTIVGPVVGGVLFGGSELLINAIDFTIPVLEMKLGALRPLPLLVLAMLALVFAPDGAVPENIHLGRKLLAMYRGEEVGGESPDKPDTSAISEILENYREELREITGEKGGRNR